MRNPALAGIFSGNVRFSAAYRNQWESVTTPYRTMALGAETRFLKVMGEGDFMTAGFQLTNDQAGDSKLQRTQFFPVLNYHKLLNGETSTYLSAAFMGGPVNESFDPSKLQFDDQFVNGSYSQSNPTSQTFTRTNFTYWDASTGLSFSTLLKNNLKFYVGVGLYHFTSPKLSFIADNNIQLNKKWIFNGGLSTYTSDFDNLIFYADYFMQGGDRVTQGGILLTHNFDTDGDDSRISITGGLAYRLKDALVPVVKLKKEQLSIGLSYDVNISKLSTASSYRGGFELTLTYKDFWNKTIIEESKMKCPVIW
jgi:type IX secretion system PorP/SprF family membrane protein